MPPSHYSSVITPSCHHRPRGGSIHPARSSCALYQMDIPLSACVPERTGPFLLPETLDIIIGLFCYEFRENARVSPAFRLVIHNFHHLPVIQERFGKMMDEQKKFYLLTTKTRKILFLTEIVYMLRIDIEWRRFLCFFLRCNRG